MNILQQSATMTMVAAPAASEEISPNRTIMACLDLKSHSSLTFSFTSQGILYSRNVQKCKTSFKKEWAQATHINTDKGVTAFSSSHTHETYSSTC